MNDIAATLNGASIGMFNGMKLIVVPDSQSVRRSWRERLFSRPWRPWAATKIVPTHWPETLKEGCIISKQQGTIYMRAHTAAALKQHIEALS